MTATPKEGGVVQNMMIVLRVPWMGEWQEGKGPKMWKFCLTSFMDGPLGYAMLARLNYPPVPSSIVGDLKQWPTNFSCWPEIHSLSADKDWDEREEGFRKIAHKCRTSWYIFYLLKQVREGNLKNSNLDRHGLEQETGKGALYPYLNLIEKRIWNSDRRHIGKLLYITT